MIRRLILAGLAAAAPFAASAQAPRKLDLVMAPHASAHRLDVTMTMAAPDFQAGEAVVRLPLKLVGIPTARYDGDALRASDAAGPLPLVQEEEPPTPQGVYRRWKATRASRGDVVIRYAAPPRAVSAATNNGPLFDLREEGGGFVGAGVGFIATPARSGPWAVSLKWDLRDAPPGSRGAWSLGEGDVDVVVPSDVLSFSYYAVGPLNSIPAAGGGGFGMYWLGTPPFDPQALGTRIQQLYAAMSAFFHDTGKSYRVFARQNPYAGLGGSALARSFMFGYRPADRPTLDKLQSLIAHEMAHNWPKMRGEHGDTAWYSEGTAEYYSLILAHRAGLLDADRLLTELNKRAYDYATNPFRPLSNVEAAKRFWTDPTAQTIPYGRGLIYLIQTDAAIRTASGGKRSLDDVVLAMRARELAGQPYGIPDWLALVGQEIGAATARQGYDAMASGALLRAPANRFAPCYRLVPGTAQQFELGFARASLSDDRVVRGLVPGSAAALAGVRDGDVIVEAGDLNTIRSEPAATMTLTLRRGDATTTVRYAPRGASVSLDRWQRDPAAPAPACRF